MQTSQAGRHDHLSLQKRGIFKITLHELIIPSLLPTVSTYMNQSKQIETTVEKLIF